MASNSIESVLQESRRFDPPAASDVGASRWLVSSMDEYREMFDRSINDPESFYSEIADELREFPCVDARPQACQSPGASTPLVGVGRGRLRR